MKNVIITGASRGIGFEMAKLFADEGHQVLALSRNEKPISALNHKNIYAFSCLNRCYFEFFEIKSRKDEPFYILRGDSEVIRF